jgi:hypothetical protein
MSEHTAALDHGLVDAIRETHSSFISIDAIEKVNGEPVAYEVLFTHRYKVAATEPVLALAAALALLRAATGGAS